MRPLDPLSPGTPTDPRMRIAGARRMSRTLVAPDRSTRSDSLDSPDRPANN